MNQARAPRILAHLGCALGLCLALVGVGCNRGPRLVPAAGRVTFDDGQPLSGGSIELESLPESSAPGLNARGTLDDQGRFQLSTGAQFGAVPGRHAVIVMQTKVLDGLPRDLQHSHEADHRPRSVPQAFGSYATSGLVLEIPQEGSSELVLRIDDRPADSSNNTSPSGASP
jgi:hypothetical protein